MPYQYLVPRDTQGILQRAETDCMNLGLVLDRYIPWEAIRNDDIRNHNRVIGKVRTEWLKKTLERFTGPELKELLGAALNRWLALTANAFQFEMRSQSRVVVGLGDKGPLEFGITLHPITGLPHIPGSALKGLCRSYALLTIAAHDRVQVAVETEALKRLDEALIAGQYDARVSEAIHYRQAFGSQENAGQCIFYDAIVSNVRLNAPIVTLDVMTPHFVKYYTNGGRQAPDDSDQPNPVNYLTVTEGTSFAFAVGARTGFVDNGTTQQAAKWLWQALQEMGIGAKTAQGYGVFVPTE